MQSDTLDSGGNRAGNAKGGRPYYAWQNLCQDWKVSVVNFQLERNRNSCSDLLSQNMRCLLKENFSGLQDAQLT